MTKLKLRKRLRRYAFLGLLTTLSGIASTTIQANDTHDSTDMCGWYEPEPINHCVEAVTSGGSDSQPTCTSDLNLNTVQSSSRCEKLSAPFVAVELGAELIVDTCNYDRWLAANVTVAAPSDAPLNAEPAEKDFAEPVTGQVELNSTIAAVAAAATVGNPLPFGQWIEPFAMVGPAGGHTAEQVKAFQDWFAEGKRAAEQLCEESFEAAKESLVAAEESWVAAAEAFVPVVDFDGIVADTLATERIASDRVASDRTAEAEGSLIVVETTPAMDQAASLLPSRFVGASPIVAFIEEAYSPYDLDDRDRVAADLAVSSELAESHAEVVWPQGVFHPLGHPFCVRSLAMMRELDWSPLATSVPSQAPNGDVPNSLAVHETKVSAADPMEGSLECLMDEWIWQAGNLLEEAGVASRWFRPRKIGTQVAELVVTGDKWITEVATGLAAIWPDKKQPAGPDQGAGARLLARAEAAEQFRKEDLATPSNDEQLAQATATLMQWVDTAQVVIDDLSDRLTEVTEVARNRGAQDGQADDNVVR